MFTQAEQKAALLKTEYNATFDARSNALVVINTMVNQAAKKAELINFIDAESRFSIIAARTPLGDLAKSYLKNMAPPEPAMIPVRLFP